MEKPSARRWWAAALLLILLPICLLKHAGRQHVGAETAGESAAQGDRVTHLPKWGKLSPLHMYSG